MNFDILYLSVNACATNVTSCRFKSLSQGGGVRGWWVPIGVGKGGMGTKSRPPYVILRRLIKIESSLNYC